jgi:phosphatidylinositol glycan class B
MSSPLLRPSTWLAVLLVAGALRIGFALASPNLFWPDEVFQTLEPAHRLVFGAGIESFEWRIGLRSYVVPGLLAGVVAATAPLWDGSAGYLTGVVVVLALVSLVSVVAAARIAAGGVGGVGGVPGARAGVAALLAAVLVAVWFDVVYFAPKALTEVLAGHLLVPAVAIVAAASARQTDAAERGHRHGRRVFVAAVLLGLSAAVRPHLAPGVAVALLWLVAASPRERWRAALLGAALPVVAFGLVDWVTHGRPFASLLVNFTFNVGEGRSLDYGWLPKHQYAVYLWETWTPPVAIAFGVLWCLSLRAAPLPALVALSIVGSHSLLGHKEYRFVQPAVPLLLVGVAVGAANVVGRLRETRRGVAVAAFVVVFAGASVWAGSGFHWGKTPTGLSGKRGSESHWTAHGDALRAMRELSRRSDVRGVAVTGIEWQFSGGYAWLHHAVPLYFVDLPETPGPVWENVDHVVAKGAAAGVPAAFVEVARFGEVRVLRREGEVVVRAGYDVNQVLQARKE